MGIEKAVVIGGSGAVGKATVSALAARGIDVVAAGHEQDGTDPRASGTRSRTRPPRSWLSSPRGAAADGDDRGAELGVILGPVGRGRQDRLRGRPSARLDRWPAPLAPAGVARAIVEIADGVHPDATALGVGGEGIEVL
jgi:NAD(P)-dependent dehydrogenase (short-subunit alcohol dehydrogenase family)